MKFDSKILNQRRGVKPATVVGRAVAPGQEREGDNMGYIIAWLLGVPVTLLVLFWLFFGR